jgi:hypothetical protein
MRQITLTSQMTTFRRMRLREATDVLLSEKEAIHAQKFPVRGWLNASVHAWKTDDLEVIGNLFNEAAIVPGMNGYPKGPAPISLAR